MGIVLVPIFFNCSLTSPFCSFNTFLTILFIFIIVFTYLILKISQEQISNIHYIFYTFLFGSFAIQSVFNCLFISLLELNEVNKKFSKDKSI